MFGIFSGIPIQVAGSLSQMLAQSDGSAGSLQVDGLILGVLAVGAGALLALRAGRRQFPEARADFGLLWFINRFWAVAWYRLQRVGPCTVPAAGPVILTANHGSTSDPLMLYATCPHRVMGFLIAREYARLPVLRYFTDVVQCIPVNRDGHDTAATKAALRRLHEGRMLGVFLEGRISEPGRPEPAKDGVALLALHTGASVIPAYISGLVYRDGVAASFFARHRARVRYGPPVDLSEFAGHDRETLRGATRKIQAAIEILKEQARLAGERVETSPRPL